MVSVSTFDILRNYWYCGLGLCLVSCVSWQPQWLLPPSHVSCPGSRPVAVSQAHLNVTLNSIGPAEEPSSHSWERTYLWVRNLIGGITAHMAGGNSTWELSIEHGLDPRKQQILPLNDFINTSILSPHSGLPSGGDVKRTHRSDVQKRSIGLQRRIYRLQRGDWEGGWGMWGEVPQAAPSLPTAPGCLPWVHWHVSIVVCVHLQENQDYFGNFRF